MADDATGNPESEGAVPGPSARQKSAKRSEARAMQPPLTPMIDVTFLLLIFFLLACQFKVAEGVILAEVPDLAKRDPLDTERIEITITPTGMDGAGAEMRIRDIGVARNITDLREMLASLREGYRELKVPVVIKPEGEVYWQYPVDAFNQAVLAKYEDIAFETPRQ